MSPNNAKVEAKSDWGTRQRHGIFTICAPNYIPKMNVLLESCSRTNPELALYALVIGGRNEVLESDQLPQVNYFFEEDVLSESELQVMPFIYDITEFATALKPFAFRWMFEQFSLDKIVYLDPDIEVFGDLLPVIEDLDLNEVVVTPHVLEFFPEDDFLPTSQDISLAGIYNLGFIGVRSTAKNFLNWWCDRLRYDCIFDLPRGLHVDQKWIDWAPSLFDVGVIKDPTLNVAYWNLHERSLQIGPRAGRANQVTVSGRPLTFFHFSGFDPSNPRILSRHTSVAPRVQVSDNDALVWLTNRYASLVAREESRFKKRGNYLYERASSGLVFTMAVRRALRDAVKANHLKIERASLPVIDEQAFKSWLTERQGVLDLTPLEVGVWLARADLRGGLERLEVASAIRMRDWAQDSPEFRSEIMSAGLTVPKLQSQSDSQNTATPPIHGLSVMAYARAELGVGEAGRRLFNMIRLTGFPSELVGLEGHASRAGHEIMTRTTSEPKYPTVISSVNADQIPHVSKQYGITHKAKRHIGYWAWELEEFPEAFRDGVESVDEVWAMSSFIARSIEEKLDKSVSVLPVPFLRLSSTASDFDRKILGLPEDKFLFLTSFDYLSVPVRKNPESTLRAYLNTFDEKDGSCLIIKSINHGHNPKYRAKLRSIAGKRSDVLFMDHYLTQFENLALIKLADVFVSLHRSEGYGINLADAMSLGTPVIATNYGGNLDFMSNDSAGLVDFDYVNVGLEGYPYSPSARWAEPDIDHAAKLMSKMVNDTKFRMKLIENSLNVARNLSQESVAATARRLLEVRS